MKTTAILPALALAAALGLAACGSESETGAETAEAEPDFSNEIAEDLAALDAGRPEPIPGDWNQTPRNQANALFRAMCSSRGIDAALCECVESRLTQRLGPDALLSVASTFTGRTDLAMTVSERVTASEGMQAATAYQSLTRTCRAELAAADAPE